MKIVAVVDLGSGSAEWGFTTDLLNGKERGKGAEKGGKN